MTSLAKHLPFALAVAVALPWAVPAAAAPTAAAPTAFKVYVELGGVYRVSWEDLAAAGLAANTPSGHLAMTHRGEAVPIFVADGGDGRFGPGDHLEFLGEHLPGERSRFNEHTELNVYRLAAAAPGGARMHSPPPGEAAAVDWSQQDRLTVTEHLEADRLMLRFASSPRAEAAPEPWYWTKLTHIDAKPFRQRLDLSAYRPTSEHPVRLRIQLQGWSTQSTRRKGKPADHRVEVALNGHPVGHGEWDGQLGHLIEIEEVPGEALRRGANLLTIEVPKRRPTPEGDPIIDVVVLNWIEIHYPRRRQLSSAQARLELVEVEAAGPLMLITEPGEDLLLFGADGSRLDHRRLRRTEEEHRTRHFFQPSPGQSIVHAVAGGVFPAPAAVEADHPSDLRRASRQADYLMIAHPRLLPAIEPLAELHRRRGLTVEVVDVVDVYDEFNHGILDPRAIRDFLRYTHRHWQSPAPRFVLLVGDASWDTKNPEAKDKNYADWTYRPGEKRGFVKNGSTPYSSTTSVGHRNLVPTWRFESRQGHAASDNFFVALGDEGFHPDLAIGRFPVSEPEEVAAIVAKTIRYVESSGVGPWRRRVLWITNDRRGMQMRSDQLAEQIGERGFASHKVYPAPEEADNAQHQETLRRAFDSGQLLVHFYGHGGRYIWRTGPPDFKKNHDLFTLEHLDDLAPTAQLPMVLSMSCYSAPFDHPTADSIGEKFLRLADRGAVAVFAASWRNSPSAQLSSILIEELLAGGAIGEAVVRTKREISGRDMVEMYNLLGDPAIELALPVLPVTVERDEAAEDVTVRATVARAGFTGRAVVDWIGEAGEILASDEVPVVNAAAVASRRRGAPEVRSVRVYVWNEQEGIDGLGAALLSTSEEAAELAAVEVRPGR